MSKLEELIQKLCPNGVEYKKIEEFVDYIQPSKYIVSTTKYNDNFKTPVLTAGQSFILGYTNEENNIFEANKEKPVIIFDDFTAGYHWVDFRFKIKSSAMKILIPKGNINFRYFYHYMGRINYSSTDHTRLWIGTYSQIKIPVPPLEVQNEIVRILDNFTELTAELTAELHDRKKQYEYYENLLLFNESYNDFLLSDLCTVNQGLQIPINQRKKEPGTNRYFYITVQFLKNSGDKYYIENPSENVICTKDDILVTRTGSTGKIITGVDGCFHNNFFKVNCDESLIKRKYMFYLLNSKKMFLRMLEVASGGTVPDLPHKKFYNLKVSIPSLEEQQRIVDILDKFDSYCNDISQGLPAEIEMRKKQYEYYREKLLTFKKLEA